MRELVLALIFTTTLSGCSTMAYYRHALTGQFEIWRNQEPIEVLLERDTLSPALREKLNYAVNARDFAFERLALPDNGSYRDYVDLKRDFVVWNVFATPELSLTPVQWCYPFAGCFGYRGFFDEDRAMRRAEALETEGFEVYIGGVSAYSTLGWLDDPVLSSILNREKPRIAEIIFHELAHQRLYVKDDTTFNESFALTVATAGLRFWIPAQNGNLAEFTEDQQREREFITLILRFREKLETLYSSDEPDDKKRKIKRGVFTDLIAEYRSLKATWNGDSSYDEWMGTDLNNAKIASISTYHDHANAFMSILERYDYDFTAFYIAVENLAAFEPSERTACLSALTKGVHIQPVCSMVVGLAQP
ncbi:MAG: aminopeptidase [Gammaproteobacteria bacterium]|nr:aminopeptidase [Gammaproteobacteria bacterium]